MWHLCTITLLLDIELLYELMCRTSIYCVIQIHVLVVTGIWCGGEKLLWNDRRCSGRKSSPVELPSTTQWGTHTHKNTICKEYWQIEKKIQERRFWTIGEKRFVICLMVCSYCTDSCFIRQVPFSFLSLDLAYPVSFLSFSVHFSASHKSFFAVSASQRVYSVLISLQLQMFL